MAITGNLQQIRAKVRKITGRPSINQITDAELDDYINDFYVYEFIQRTKSWNLKTLTSPLIATTPGGARVLTPGVPFYAVDSNKFINIEPPFFVAGYQVQYFQDALSFLNYFSSKFVKQTLKAGTGIAGPYAGTITNIPILYNSVFISTLDAAGNTLTAGVNNLGVITGDVLAGGTINLLTGVVAGLTWTAAVPVGTNITVQTLTYISARPLAVLYIDKTLTFYPVPDIAYEVMCTVYYVPDELLAGDEPELRQWWNLIAMGAAMKIFSDNLDIESISKLKPLFDEQLVLVARTTLKQLSNQRVSTIYGGGENYPYNYAFPYN